MEFKDMLVSLGQSHVLKFYDHLSDNEKEALLSEIKELDWQLINNIYIKQILPQVERNFKVQSKLDDNLIEPLPKDRISGTSLCDDTTITDYKSKGLASINQGRVAALLLSGGQGTRLGVNFPKGMYDVGLPSHKSLFQLQAERILQLADASKDPCNQTKPIFWYIMTSEATMKATNEFFECNNYFGLDKRNIIFFEQNTFPCLDFDGRVLLEDKHKISRSPNGNGGIFEAIHERGILDHMVANGIEYIHVYCVDNILVRVCDPVFVGYCISMDVDAASKVVEKELPDESVGIICKVAGNIKVIEYSEVSENIANLRDNTTGKLVYNAANICDQFFKVDFLKRVKDDKKLPYHLAIKKIPHISLHDGEKVKPTEPNGIKLEKFIFDVFEFTDKFAVWQVKREDEFSPIKNAIGSEKDNPQTALKALLRAYDSGILTV